MRADRNKQITINTKTETQGSTGSATYVLTPFISDIWASFEPLIGREYFESNQLHTAVAGKFRIEYTAGLDTTMVITYGTRTFDITSIIDFKDQHLLNH